MYLYDPYITPVTGNITSDYGPRVSPTTHVQSYHYGIDYGVPVNTPIVAAGDGKVIGIVYDDPKAGNYIRILHPDGFVTAYLHLNSVNVFPNQQVREGAVIGYSGQSGNVTGPHLHWAMKNAKGEWVNPHNYESNKFFNTDYGKHIRATELFMWGGLALLAVGIYRSSHR